MDDLVKKVAGLDLIIHTPVRLAVLLFLLPRHTAAFPEILSALDVTSGNLSSHSKKLVEAGLIEMNKTFVNLKPTTTLHITQKGRTAINSYTLILKDVYNNVQNNDKL